MAKAITLIENSVVPSATQSTIYSQRSTDNIISWQADVIFMHTSIISYSKFRSRRDENWIKTKTLVIVFTFVYIQDSNLSESSFRRKKFLVSIFCLSVHLFEKFWELGWRRSVGYCSGLYVLMQVEISTQLLNLLFFMQETFVLIFFFFRS